MATSIQESNFILDVEDRTFDEEVLRRSMQQPILVDFWAEWCAPCKALTPILAKLAKDYGGAFLLAKVNADTNQQLALQCGIRSLPTVLLVKEGQIVDGFIGAQPEPAIRALLEKHRIAPVAAAGGEPAPKVIAAGDRKQVIAQLRSALTDKPDELGLQIQLAGLLVEEGEYTEAEQILQKIPEDKQQGQEVARLRATIRFGTALAAAPEEPVLTERLAQNPADSEARYLLGLRKAVGGDYENSLDTLLELVRRDRKYGDDAARKAMLDVFALLGGSGPLVKQYRSMLYSAMN